MDELNQLKKAGLRQTIPLLLTFQVFTREPKPHLTRDEAYRFLIAQGHLVSSTSMNRAIVQLEEVELLRRNVWQGRTTFEYDTGELHDHLICTQCCCVVEYRDAELDALISDVAASRGFLLNRRSLHTEGLCRSCQQARSGRRPKP